MITVCASQGENFTLLPSFRINTCLSGAGLPPFRITPSVCEGLACLPPGGTLVVWEGLACFTPGGTLVVCEGLACLSSGVTPGVCEDLARHPAGGTLVVCEELPRRPAGGTIPIVATCLTLIMTGTPRSPAGNNGSCWMFDVCDKPENESLRYDHVKMYTFQHSFYLFCFMTTVQYTRIFTKSLWRHLLTGTGTIEAPF